MRILYVEDQTSDREMFVRLIKVAGASRNIDVEMQSIQTLAEIGAGPLFDCILLDLSLCNGGRITTMQWVQDHSYRMPPIVILSGFAEHDEDCIRKGAEDFISKADAVANPQLFIDRIKLAILRHRMRMTPL